MSEVSPGQGVAYGLLQGLTEFLPVSSSGHLVLLPWVAGWEDPGLAFDVALHAGTLLAVLWYFGADWWRIGWGALGDLGAAEPLRSPEGRAFWKIVAASVPAAVAGLLLHDLAEESFREPLLIASTLAGVGLLLLWSDRAAGGRSDLDEISWLDALCIGAAQACALVPGVSRSGATIAAARFRGLDRETAARFSFLLSTPVIAGAVALKAPALLEVVSDTGSLIAVATAALSGWAAIAGLLRWVRTRSYAPFAVYRLGLAAVIVLLYMAPR